MNRSLLTFRDIVTGGLVVIGVLCVIAYVLFQARFLVVGPQITIDNKPELRQNARVVTLTGSTENISHLRLNGRSIFTDPSGQFSTDVVLQNGYTVVTLEAEDRYGRQTSLTREFVYAPMSFTNNQ